MNRFRSMGCDVDVAPETSLETVRGLFDQRDQRFSRFLTTSELTRVNATPSGVTLVSEELASMLALALGAARATGGLVTPAVGHALLAAGYDRDFASLPLDGDAVVPARVPSLETLSLRGRVLLRTEPVLLDLNGVVKGKTVDDALALAGKGWVSAGGDIATSIPVVVGLPGGGRSPFTRAASQRAACARAPGCAAAPASTISSILRPQTGAHPVARRLSGRPDLRRGRRGCEGRPSPRACGALLARSAWPAGPVRRRPRRSPIQRDVASEPYRAAMAA